MDSNTISIYTLTSALHDEQAVSCATRQFLSSLQFEYAYKGEDYSDYGKATLNLIFVRTGGTEGIFKTLLPQLQRQSTHPIFLLTSGQSNSLAAAMEILSYLQQQGINGEILHGTPRYIRHRIHGLLQVHLALRRLSGMQLGVIGQPSDWLISSQADARVVRQKLGIELVDIDIREVLDNFAAQPATISASPLSPSTPPEPKVAAALPDAQRLHAALRGIVERHHLSGFTIRCFDLLTTIHNTGCLALARLNADGVVAGCEGDVPAAISMMIAQALLGVTGFQCNPSAIDPDSGIITLAHCTIPFNLVTRYELDTHYESGIGVGIRGYMAPGPVTIFKVSGDLSRHFVAQGQLIDKPCSPHLCRTQLTIRLDDAKQTRYFLTHPIGNHHIVVPGEHAQPMCELLAAISD